MEGFEIPWVTASIDAFAGAGSGDLGISNFLVPPGWHFAILLRNTAAPIASVYHHSVTIITSHDQHYFLTGLS